MRRCCLRCALRSRASLPCSVKNEFVLQRSMGSDANLGEHIAWELEEDAMERRKSDCSSGGGACSVITKDGHKRLAAKEDEKHVPTDDVCGLQYAGEAEQLVLLRDRGGGPALELGSILHVKKDFG